MTHVRQLQSVKSQENFQINGLAPALHPSAGWSASGVHQPTHTHTLRPGHTHPHGLYFIGTWPTVRKASSRMASHQPSKSINLRGTSRGQRSERQATERNDQSHVAPMHRSIADGAATFTHFMSIIAANRLRKRTPSAVAVAPSEAISQFCTKLRLQLAPQTNQLSSTWPTGRAPHSQLLLLSTLERWKMGARLNGSRLMLLGVVVATAALTSMTEHV